MRGGDWSTLLKQVYPDQPDLADEVRKLLDTHNRARPVATGGSWSEHDAWLITYADQFRTQGSTPLASLRRFYNAHLRPWVNGIHILPFYPWSSDDGYSVIDYSEVDPRYGTWEDVEGLAGDARVMFDAVINHVSAGSRWFLAYLAGDPKYEHYFMSISPDTDLGRVVRPRTSPLLTPFETANGTAWVWTTFSADQVDLNYRSPELFLEILTVLLDYASRGASMIRLDAVQFLWKEIGETCINLPQGHVVIQLLRACLDEIYPDVVIVTETNVPHHENVSYFGEDNREAQMVYQFPLPPLVLDALHTGEVDLLASWLHELDPIPDGCTFLNFLSSHDGVGVRPVEGILPDERVEALVDLTRKGGGEVGVRTVGEHIAPYELNTTWFSLMETGYAPDEAVARHLASHAIMLALRGIPAIYALSLVGARSDHAQFDRTGRARSLNRTRFATEELAATLADPASIAAKVTSGLEAMLRWRSSSPAFHPDSPQIVLETPPGVLGVERGSDSSLARVYVNVTSQPVEVPWPGSGWVGNEIAPQGGAATIIMGPWDSMWLRKDR